MGLLQTHEAEGVGFEPTEPFWGSPLFESGTLNHSDTLPPGSIAQSPILPQAVDDPFSTKRWPFQGWPGYSRRKSSISWLNCSGASLGIQWLIPSIRS